MYHMTSSLTTAKCMVKSKMCNGTLAAMEDYTGQRRQKQYSATKIKNRNQDLLYDYKNCTCRKEPTPAKN